MPIAQKLNPEQLAALSMLANGIIPPDEIDGGAACVDAAARLASTVQAGVNTALYVQGLESAQRSAQESFGCDVGQLNPEQIFTLLATVQERSPGFFKQLRMDVAALYLSDPSVWERIGFPGPSITKGGYPDFDQPQ